MLDAATRGGRADTFFDPWLTLKTRLGLPHPIVLQVQGSIADREERVRKRRLVDQMNHENLVGAIVANLVQAVLTTERPHEVAVILARPTSAGSRYDSPITRKLRDTLQVCHERGLLVLTPSRTYGFASIMQPTDQFAEEVRSYGLGSNDIGRHTGEETIILSRTERDHAAQAVQRIKIDYQDTTETLRFRAELDTINAHLVKADLAFLGNGHEVNTAARRLRRIFNLPRGYPEDRPRFDMGGRLYGGWWMYLERRDRRESRRCSTPCCSAMGSSRACRWAPRGCCLRSYDRRGRAGGRPEGSLGAC